MLTTKALNLCHEIEKLPASEQQTKCSVMASDLHQQLEQLQGACAEKDKQCAAMRFALEQAQRRFRNQHARSVYELKSLATPYDDILNNTNAGLTNPTGEM